MHNLCCDLLSVDTSFGVDSALDSLLLYLGRVER